MFDDDRTKQSYKGFDLVAAPGALEAKGLASHQITRKRFSAKGIDVPAVLATLRTMVDGDLAQNRDAYLAAVSQKHKEFLVALGKHDKGRGGVSRWTRSSNCYNCKGSVTNLFDLECVACGWIVCNSCAACGCGFRGASA